MTYNRSWAGVFNPGKAADFFKADNTPFLAGKHGFSSVNGWWLAEMSRLIYLRGGRNCKVDSEQKVRSRFLNRAGLEESWYYNGQFVQCAIIRTLPEKSEPFGVLVFRGTRRGISNCSFLLNFLLVDWPAGGKVHGGFKRVLLDAWEHIHPELEKISSPLFFTGHSLGGALAVLAATLKEPAAVYSFGCPRFADANFISATRHLRIHRVVNPTDVVARIPPLPGVLHVGEPHFLENSKQQEQSSSIWDAPIFLTDHSPTNYSFRLSNIHQKDICSNPQAVKAVFREYSKQ